MTLQSSHCLSLLCDCRAFMKCVLVCNIPILNVLLSDMTAICSTALVCSFGDGKLEVIGLYSALHIARLKISLADPLRLGQARSVKVSSMRRQNSCALLKWNSHQKLCVARRNQSLPSVSIVWLP